MRDYTTSVPVSLHDGVELAFPPRLVLGSASAVRGRVLRGAGIEPVVLVSDVDEDAVVQQAQEVHGELEPCDVALLLARAKCEAVTDVWEGDNGQDAWFVLGCDSVLECDGQVHGKPGTPELARERWLAMMGGTGVLHTGHWLIDVRSEAEGGTGATFGAVASTTLSFGTFSEAELDAYIGTGEPLHVAGACTIDGLGGPFVEGIDGDHHNVLGLSLPLLRHLLDEVGVGISQVRNRPSAAV